MAKKEAIKTKAMPQSLPKSVLSYEGTKAKKGSSEFKQAMPKQPKR